ncbi:MAG: hypothetical protein IKE91_02915 [Clostridia bacterium]|nr:hypothetical protein [Clostridia bacterium]
MKENAKVTVETRSFVCIKTRFKSEIVQVESRTLEAVVEHPEECTLYFFDSYVGIVDGVEYRFGPQLNVSTKYFYAGEYYPDTVIFKHYLMRCYGWTDEQIETEELPTWSTFYDLTEEKYPKGVLIINTEIINPIDGTVVQTKKTFTEEKYPSQEIINAYLHCEF